MSTDTAVDDDPETVDPASRPDRHAAHPDPAAAEAVRTPDNAGDSSSTGAALGRTAASPPAEPGRFDPALEEARRGLDDQLTQIGQIRSMMGSLLTFSGLAIGIVGALVTPTLLGRTMTVVATALFPATAPLAAAAMWPVNFTAGLKAKELVRWADEGATRDAITRDMAIRLEDAIEKNGSSMTRLRRLRPWSIILFGATITALAIRLLGGT